METTTFYLLLLSETLQCSNSGGLLRFFWDLEGGKEKGWVWELVGGFMADYVTCSVLDLQ